MSGIHVDPTHGVAPVMMHCPVCLKDSGLALVGRRIHKLASDAGKSAERFMREGVLDQQPCTECQGYMEKGVIMIGVDESKTTDMKNPWRTGRFAVIRDSALERLVQPPELLQQILAKRVMYAPDAVFEMLGIPESTEKESSHE